MDNMNNGHIYGSSVELWMHVCPVDGCFEELQAGCVVRPKGTRSSSDSGGACKVQKRNGLLQISRKSKMHKSPPKAP